MSSKKVQKLFLSASELADAYAKARAAKSAAERLEKDLRKQVLNRLDVLGVDTLAGDEAVIDRTQSGRWLLDDEKLLKLISPVQLEACKAEVPVITLTVKAVPVAAQAVAA